MCHNSGKVGHEEICCNNGEVGREEICRNNRKVVREDMQGKIKETMLNSLALLYEGISLSEMIDSTRDRRLWLDLITNTMWHEV